MDKQEAKSIDQKNNSWMILCPGKSLAKADLTGMDTSKTIAVNGAIFKERGALTWAIQDPALYFDVMRKMSDNFQLEDIKYCVNKLTVLWTPDSWITHEDRALNLSGAPREYSYTEMAQMTYRKGDLANVLQFGWEFSWDEYTMFSAIAYALIRGAKRVEIIGADLKGEGYFREGLENEGTNHSEKRWNDELDKYSEIVAKCWDRDILVTRRQK